jgi:hypothetical protein
VGVGDDLTEAHATERSSDVLPAGTYTVDVQYAVSRTGLGFQLNGWHMTVERVRVH